MSDEIVGANKNYVSGHWKILECAIVLRYLNTGVPNGRSQWIEGSEEAKSRIRKSQIKVPSIRMDNTQDSTHTEWNDSGPHVGFNILKTSQVVCTTSNGEYFWFKLAETLFQVI